MVGLVCTSTLSSHLYLHDTFDFHQKKIDHMDGQNDVTFVTFTFYTFVCIISR